jgi:23S rRNA pseudouridine2605 synthase
MMSRRRAEELIRSGRVAVDGRTAVLGDRADPAQSVVTVDGTPLPLRPDLRYVLANKPAGVVSTVSDPQGRPTIVDMVGADERLYPVGRLDIDSTGLLLLTNDGTLTNLVTHPRYEVEKTYLALVSGNPGAAALRRLESGVKLDDGIARARSARVTTQHRGRALVEIVMTEGRKREVRRMLAEVGHTVVELTRTAIGPVRDAGLEPGAWRELDVDEVRSLYAAAGATWQDAPTVITEAASE